MKSALMLLIIGPLAIISANKLKYISADIANIRSRPVAVASLITKLHINTAFVVKSEKEEWLEIQEVRSVKGKKLPLSGWVHSSLVQERPVTLAYIEKELKSDTGAAHRQRWADRMVALRPDDRNIWKRYRKIVKDSAKLLWAEQRLEGKEDVYVSYVNYDGAIYLLGKIDSAETFFSLFAQQFNDHFDRYPAWMNYENEEQGSAMFTSLTAQTQALRWYAQVSKGGEYTLLEGTPFIATLTPGKLIKLGNRKDIEGLYGNFLFSSPVRICDDQGGIDSMKIVKELLTKSKVDSSRCRIAYEDQGRDKPMALKRLISGRIGLTDYYRVSCLIKDMGNSDTIISHFVVDKNCRIRWQLSGRGRAFESPWYGIGPEGEGRLFTITEGVDPVCGCTCGDDMMGYIAACGKEMVTESIPTWSTGDGD